MEIVKLAINLDLGVGIVILLVRQYFSPFNGGSMDKGSIWSMVLPANHVNSMGTE